MKKKLAIILCTSLTFTLFACGGKNPQSSSATSNTTSVEKGSKTSNGKDSESASSKGKNSSNKTNGSASTEGSSENDISGIKLTELLDKICKDTKIPMSEIFELNKENFEIYSFIKWVDGIEASCSEGQISTDAHSLVLIRVNGADTKTIAEEIAAKADPRKWICVGAETSKVLYTENYVLMVMTYKDAYEGIKANFEKLMGDEVKVIEIKKSGNL